MRVGQVFPDLQTGFVSKAVFGLMVVMIGVGAWSSTAGAVPRKVKRECKSDYKSLCPHYKPGTSRMRSCMRANGSQLSWGCYQALKDYGYVRSSKRRGRRGRRRRR